MSNKSLKDVQNILMSIASDVSTTEELNNVLNTHEDVKVKLAQNEDFSVVVRYEDEDYMFEYDATYIPESSLFFSYVAKSLGIKVTDTTIVELGNFKGFLFQKSYDRHTTYVSSEDLLRGSDAERSRDYLENVHSALHDRYSSRTDGDEIIERLLDKITHMVILNIVLGIPKWPNWTLEEYSDGRIDLAPLEPYAMLFGGSLKRSPVASEEQKNLLIAVKEKTKIMLDDFYRAVDDSGIQTLIESLWVLKKEKVEDAFKKMKDDTVADVKRLLQIKFSSLCRDHLDFLKEAIGVDKLPISKDVDASTILSMSNPVGYYEGQAAISIITPTEVHHAIQAKGYLVHHEDLFTDVYERLYGVEPTDLRLSFIEIHHICYNAYERAAYVFVPYRITESEYVALSEILVGLNERGVEIVAKHTGFDPVNNCFQKGEEDAFESLNILDHLKSGGFVCEFDWKFKKIGTSESSKHI